MSEQLFQVTSECAYVTVDSPYGRTKTLLYKGAVFPGSAPERDHLVSSGMAVPFGPGDDTGLNAEGGLGPAEADSTAPGSVVAPVAAALEVTGSPNVTPPAGSSDEEKAEAVRAAARAKLPADGSAPHPNAGQAVWVEYAVSKGMDRGEAEKADKQDLIAALKS